MSEQVASSAKMEVANAVIRMEQKEHLAEAAQQRFTAEASNEIMQARHQLSSMHQSEQRELLTLRNQAENQIQAYSTSANNAEAAFLIFNFVRKISKDRLCLKGHTLKT